ncbi:uncharacterized protein LOC110826828 [Zootermopsis nevadensis]|uniref:Lysosomal-associated transmembrane protein 4B n=1 Tax=Zootermopsis nevadensis TaxID=136037 RepID=A0A067RPB8_ZOONE|nr:uncharacterized protein LOC110826828 [Zootermopsis nevadensis]XP_021913546.1 uncharacterized protein LOC110826828 [Zootermopsis nevadensis]KDR22480.1 hypothetical protein L798_02279 [Zootermopsis nevadensis]
MGFKIKCVPVLDKMICCCCSCNLKTATIILGWISLIGQVMGFVTSAVRLAMFDKEQAVLMYDSQESLIAALVSSAVNMLIYALLLYGAHEERPAFMLPYVILGMIGLIICAVAVVIIGIFFFVENIIIAGVVVLILGGLTMALASFFWLVIYSYYRQLEERQHLRPAPLDIFVAGKTSDQE